MVQKQDELGTIFYQNERHLLHNPNGPSVITRDGDQHFHINGLRHREDGPAVIKKESKEWYLNGERHNSKGPAFVSGDISKWYVEGKQLISKDVQTAKDILSGKLTHKLPLFINHPILKHFAKEVLQNGPRN